MPSSLELWPAQQAAYEFAITRDECALFCQQRTGKTFITMAILRKLAGNAINLKTGEGNDFCGFLICLLNNKDSTWRDKLDEYLPWLNVTDDWEKFKKLPCPRLFLIHFDMLPRLIKRLCKYKKFNWGAIDEAHRIARRGNKWSRACARMSWVRRKLILTGTPIEKKPVDLFAQFRFLQSDVFGTNWEEFENEYLDFATVNLEGIPYGSLQWQKKILQQRILRSKAKFREEKLPQLVELIKPYSYRLTKEDVGIIEPEVHKEVVPIIGRQRRYYDRMQRHSIIRLSSGQRVLAELRVTMLMKLRQIASGFVYDDDEKVRYVGDAKLRRLKEMFEDLPKPVVVFTAFRPDNDQVAEELRDMGYDIIEVHGKVKKKFRPDIWRKFQKAEYDGIVCQVKTGGVGVDLWKASNAIVHSMGYSYIDFDQAKARMDSRDKNKAAKIFVLCAEETIDEDIYDLVIVKGLDNEKVLSQLKRRIPWRRQRRRQ